MKWPFGFGEKFSKPKFSNEGIQLSAPLRTPERTREEKEARRQEAVDMDMDRLSDIEQKIQDNQELTRSDLKFLYEIDSRIQCQGYRRDPRIKELRAERKHEADLLTIFECAKDQIARNPKEINETTKAYVGPLEPGIFNLIRQYDIKHIYTSFPEGRIRQESLEIGGKDKNQLKKELEKEAINTFSYAGDMLLSKEFTTLEAKEQINLVRLTVNDLFADNKIHTTQEIYQRAEELGLELCPEETGPNLRLKYQDQPLNEWIYIATKQITDRVGDPYVFGLGRDGGGLWLGDDWTYPAGRWGPDGGFVFRK